MNNNLCYLGGMINIILLYTGIILIHLICLTILPNSHSTQTVLIGDFIIPYYSIYLVIIILLPILLIIVPLLIFKVNHIGFYIISIFIEFDMIYMLVMFIIFIFKCSKDLTICNSNNIVEDVEEDIFKDDIALNDMTDDVNIENISIIFKDETVDNIDPTNDNIDSINNVMMNI